MTFTEWLTDDLDAFDGTCTVELPTIRAATTGDRLGIGALTPPVVVPVSLRCQEIPQAMVLQRTEAVYVTAPLRLLIHDPYGYVIPERRIIYQTRRYRVTQQTSATQHAVKLVALEGDA